MNETPEQLITQAEEVFIDAIASEVLHRLEKCYRLRVNAEGSEDHCKLCDAIRGLMR